MRFEHELRVRLHERRNRLYKAGHQIFDNEETLMLAWMESEPYIAALLREIEAAELDFKRWKEESVSWQQLTFPDTEIDRAKACLGAMREHDFRGYAHSVSSENRFDEMARDYVEAFVDPLVNYLEDRIDDGSAILGILERYKRRTEWFHQDELHALYEADTTRGEASLDAHLREYLVDQGIAFPFSQPRSPSGQADVVSLGDDPLALEIKLFLPSAGKDAAYVRQGFAQAHRYAADYGLPSGYLVVFNLTDGLLLFEGDHEDRWPPSVAVGNRTVFLLAIDAHPNRPSASKDRKLSRVEIDRAFLLDRASR